MFTALWIAWIAAFGVIEGVAIWKDSRDTKGAKRRILRTLSVHLRRWFRTDERFGRTLWIVVSGCGLGWLIVHIAVAGSI